ncbi:prepilin peptidase [uncultured Methanobrevibacter sp.]|uniref:prepilin peptidase n=1 Tax=uncultured Methanobrevibacter sp. TaxID=253161 RepID=UPI0025E0D517|nr:A24 family peptidase [uncultured Methanobrevibacter sp.]
MILDSIFLIQLIITVLFSVIAAIYDVKYGIVPDKLNYILLVFGIVSNLILSIISSNVKFILASFISMIITYTITFMLWKLKMWGGGDVKLFTAIATVIPSGLNIGFLNIFPELSIYPFSFSVLINSILVSFPFLVVFISYLILKKGIFKNNIDFLVNIFNINSLKYIINSTLNKRILVKDLKEGNIINNYYFNNEDIIRLVEQVDGNLKVYENVENDGFKYYFKSLSAGGITKEDMYMLKILNAQSFISDEISIKITFPFTPAIFLGLLIAVFYGDIMMIFAKNLFLVI